MGWGWRTARRFMVGRRMDVATARVSFEARSAKNGSVHEREANVMAHAYPGVKGRTANTSPCERPRSRAVWRRGSWSRGSSARQTRPTYAPESLHAQVLCAGAKMGGKFTGWQPVALLAYAFLGGVGVSKNEASARRVAAQTTQESATLKDGQGWKGQKPKSKRRKSTT